ncbi:hypothetical protein ACTFIV_009310 [Dictyostelium citrinum]
MKWYQLNIEGSQPPVRISHSSTILISKQDGASCSNYNVNDLGTIAFFGGGSSNSSNGYTDLAFLSVGGGVTDEIARPQNTQSIGKLNKILGSNVNNSAANGSTVNSNNNNNNIIQKTLGFSKNITTTTSTTTTTTTTTSTTTTSSNNSNNNNNNCNNSAQIRKTYSKLPQYTGPTIYHWENSTCDGDIPSNRINHSLTALNGNYKGKLLLIGGMIVGDSSNNNYSNGSNNRGGNSNSNSNIGISLSNDIYLLDCESLFWVKCQASGNQPKPRHSHFVHQISNDTILLFGGIGENGQIYSDVHLLNLSNQNTLKWTQPNVFGTIFNLKDKDYKVCFSNGFLWIIISECMEMYKMDINTFRWSPVIYNGNFPHGGFLSEYTLIGGCFGNIILLLVENEIFFFDTVSLEWGELEVDGGERPMKRKYHSISVIDTMLIVVGGQTELPLSTISTRDIEMIDLRPLFLKKKIIK